MQARIRLAAVVAPYAAWRDAISIAICPGTALRSPCEAPSLASAMEAVNVGVWPKSAKRDRQRVVRLIADCEPGR